MATLDKAIAIAAKAFEGVYDKGGKPYILHCLWVMDKVRHLGEDYMIVAVLHDLVEDTSWNLNRLISVGFSLEVVQAIGLLTKYEDTNLDDYFEAISTNDLARQVKLRDLEHNSKITRLKGLAKKDLRRAAAYHKAYTYLKSV